MHIYLWQIYPPVNQGEMPCILLHPTGQIYWQIYPTPTQSSIDSLNTTTPSMADLPPFNRAEMPCILLHQTWQIYWQTYPLQLSIVALNTATPNLPDLLAYVPPSNKHRCLEYHCTKLAKSTGRSASPSIMHSCLEYCYTKLARSTGISNPPQSSIDALNTITPTCQIYWQIYHPVNRA